MQGWLLVRNAASGGDGREEVAALQRALGPRAEVAVTEHPGELDRVLDRLSGRVLVVCGGDGSLHVAVARLRARGRLEETLLGVVPLGTGNDLARTLGLPGDPEEAAALLRAGRSRRMDLLVADDGQICVNGLGAGVGAEAAEQAAELKDPLGRLAYPLGALIAGASADGLDVEVSVDGRPLRPEAGGRVLMVAIANGPTIGGGTRVAPDAVPDDGRCEVVVSRAVGAGARVAFGAALLAGTHLQRADVTTAVGERVTITGEPVVYNVDGESGEQPHSSRTWRLQPGAWRVLSPPRP